MPEHEPPHPAPAGATPVRCRPRFPSRNRRFPDRCRSPDCASIAFRCRCLLLWQKLFVLPCRRLRNNYILCPTGTPTFAAARRQRRDLIIATRPAHQPLPSLPSAAAAQAVQAIPEPTTMSPTAPIPRVHTAKFALARPAPRDPYTVGLSDFLSHISFFAERNVAAGGRFPVRGKPTRRRSGETLPAPRDP